MTRRQLHRALARRTGESVSVLRRLGFQLYRVPAPVKPARPHSVRPQPTMAAR